MSDPQPPKTKRAAKRYPYARLAICDVGGEKMEVQLLNISTSGIQFATRTDITSKESIKISWRDAAIGQLEPTVLIARKIHQPEQKDFKFFYGSQYYSLKPETKNEILKLLKSLKEVDTNENFRQVASVPTHNIFDVINKGSMFLQGVFNGGEKKEPFESIINDFKDYERLAFTKVDPLSGTIQRLAAHNFHCLLLIKMLPLIVEKNELGPLYFEHVFKKMGEIAEIEKEIRDVLDDPNLEKQPQKKVLQKLFRESSNRLFYNQQTLLHNILEDFSNNEHAQLNWSTQLEKIKTTHEALVAATTAITAIDDEQLIYKRRTKKPEEYSKVEAVVDLPALEDHKINYRIVFGVLFLIASALGFGLHKFMEAQEQEELTESLKLPIEITKIYRDGSQVNLTFSSEAWDKTPNETKNELYKKLIQYLQKQKTLSSCSIFLTNNTMAKTLYKTSVVSDGAGLQLSGEPRAPAAETHTPPPSPPNGPQPEPTTAPAPTHPAATSDHTAEATKTPDPAAPEELKK